MQWNVLTQNVVSIPTICVHAVLVRKIGINVLSSLYEVVSQQTEAVALMSFLYGSDSLFSSRLVVVSQKTEITVM